MKREESRRGAGGGSSQTEKGERPGERKRVHKQESNKVASWCFQGTTEPPSPARCIYLVGGSKLPK